MNLTQIVPSISPTKSQKLMTSKDPEKFSFSILLELNKNPVLEFNLSDCPTIPLKTFNFNCPNRTFEEKKV